MLPHEDPRSVHISVLMPLTPWSIPSEFYDGYTFWNKLVTKWFFVGLSERDMNAITPKENIDTTKAMKHLRAIMTNLEIKHEDKEASIAYLMSLWFERN
jgi:hypothetical protein